jgi:hypothetical protein
LRESDSQSDSSLLEEGANSKPSSLLLEGRLLIVAKGESGKPIKSVSSKSLVTAISSRSLVMAISLELFSDNIELGCDSSGSDRDGTLCGLGLGFG